MLADRNFCTLDILRGVSDRNAFFLVRDHAHLHLVKLSEPLDGGRTETDRVSECRVRLGQAADGPACRCVVIHLDRPTVDRDTEVAILRNVASEACAARTWAELYRGRWKIEGAFQELTDHLRCEGNTRAYPRAALFGFTLAVLAYNLLGVLEGALACVRTVEKVEQELSSYVIADHVACFTAGMLVALPEPAWEKFQAFTADSYRIG